MSKEYKVCGFKDKIKVCNFKPEHCNKKDCDFFELEFTSKAIKKRVKEERKEVIRLTDEMQAMKKKGEHKVNAEKYQKLKDLRKDKVMGMMKLSKSYMYCKRTKK